MSKYIRTENRVYEVLSNEEDGCYCDNRGLYKYISNFEIINQADTIQNVIDCIVVDYGHYKHFMSKPFGYAIENIVKNWSIMKNVKEGTIKVYGAVWCEFGLKYVAKLNDRGELELL